MKEEVRFWVGMAVMAIPLLILIGLVVIDSPREAFFALMGVLFVFVCTIAGLKIMGDL